ncbi:MAG: ATP-binding cassette domain-containing protein [Spirochaetes bacterium]|nr:ATP-binding cassette domain-containing protein [Spirochaetota bacterium]
MNPLIRLNQVGFRYRGAKAPILRGVNLIIRRGDRILLRGRSGSGKSSLLLILAGLAPEYVTGEIWGERELGYHRRAVVLQNPEAQVVTPTVEEEVAFALENQGKDPVWIRRRVRQTLEALGIAHLSARHPLSLSGGECQRVSLAAAIAMEPDVLFLDEPTSYLDEDSSQKFFQALELLHPETSLVMVEHRLEAASRVCQKAFRVQEDGSLLESDFTPEQGESGGSYGEIAMAWGRKGDAPAGWKHRLKVGTSKRSKDFKDWTGRVPILTIEGLSHQWPQNGKQPSEMGTVLFHDLHLTVRAGEMVALLGPSGAGKTTLLGKISGRLPIEKGRVFIEGKDIVTISKETFYSLFMLIPQNPEHMFLSETVREELSTVQKSIDRADAQLEMERIAERFGLTHRLEAHPFRLSEGEKRRLNLAVAFQIKRPLYLLDEPTYGLDEHAKILLRKDLQSLTEEGAGVLFVTHDKGFAETTADTVYTLKDGQLIREVKHEPICCPA